MSYSPNYSKRVGRVHMDEERSNLVLVVEDKTIPPGDNSTGQGAMREAIASNEQNSAAGEDPEVDEVEDGDIVAEVEEEVVPGALLVLVVPERQQIEPLDSIRYVNPSKEAGR